MNSTGTYSIDMGKFLAKYSFTGYMDVESLGTLAWAV